MKTIIDEEKPKCKCPKCQCSKCGSRQINLIRKTKRLGPNHYRLTDWYVCKKCKVVFKDELGEHDFNNINLEGIQAELIN